MRISGWSSDVCSSEAVVAGQVDQGSVVDDAAPFAVPSLALTDHRRLHSVVQQLTRHAADRLEGGDVAAQHRRLVLMGDEASPDQAAVAQDWKSTRLNYRPTFANRKPSSR